MSRANVSVTVTVRNRASQALEAALQRLGLSNRTSYVVPDSPKMLRETLCVAQGRVGNSPLDEDRKQEHMDRLQRLIDECDRHRPLGRGGKHGDLHTPTCGCNR